MPVEAKVVAGERFRQQNDLPGVLCEVLNHTLDIVDGDQFLCAQAADDCDRFLYSPAQLGSQCGAGLTTARVELKMPNACVFRASQSADDPLANVAGEVQSQVPGSVLIFTGARRSGATHPDLIVS
jgi:hypothetical protein